MAICSGCSGVLGRDCFNERDCVEISYNMQQDLAWENYCLRGENEFLKKLLQENNIKIPEKPIEEKPESEEIPF